MSRSKSIGTAAETAVVKACHAAGFIDAHRLVLAGSQDHGDVSLYGNPRDGIIFEVKGGEAAKTASPVQIGKWLRETETEVLNSGALAGFLVVQRRGVGHARAGMWPVYCRLSGLVRTGAFMYAPGSHADMVLSLQLQDLLTCFREAGAFILAGGAP